MPTGIYPRSPFTEKHKRNMRLAHKKKKKININEKRERKKEYDRRWKEKNPNYGKEYNKKWYQKNKDRVLKKQQGYYKRNKRKIIKRIKKYQKENIEERKKYLQKPEVKIKFKEYMKEYRQKNKERILKKTKEYRQRPEIKVYRKNYNKEYEKNKKRKDKNYNIKIRLRILLFRALEKYTKTGKIMSSKKYGIDYKAIIEYLKPFPENLQDYEIHHIEPLSTFNFINLDGSTNLEEVKKAFAPENHKLLTIEEHKGEHRKLNHRG